MDYGHRTQQLYNDGNADGADAYVAEAATFGSCKGHADMRGCYHYHSECSNRAVTKPVYSLSPFIM